MFYELILYVGFGHSVEIHEENYASHALIHVLTSSLWQWGLLKNQREKMIYDKKEKDMDWGGQGGLLQVRPVPRASSGSACYGRFCSNISTLLYLSLSFLLCPSWFASFSSFFVAFHCFGWIWAALFGEYKKMSYVQICYLHPLTRWYVVLI